VGDGSLETQEPHWLNRQTSVLFHYFQNYQNIWLSAC
jgi:hypothetical protein